MLDSEFPYQHIKVTKSDKEDTILLNAKIHYGDQEKIYLEKSYVVDYLEGNNLDKCVFKIIDEKDEESIIEAEIVSKSDIQYKDAKAALNNLNAEIERAARQGTEKHDF